MQAPATPAPRPAAPVAPTLATREASTPMEEWPAPLRPRRPSEAAAAPHASRSALPEGELTGRLESGPAAATAPPSLRVVAVGHGFCDDQRTVQLPLELQDAEGRRFRVTLSLAIGPLLTGGD